MTRKQRLELTWIGKDERPHLEPRILLEDAGLSHHAKVHVTEKDIFDNILIHGDNLLALKALEQEFTGKVKCIYLDPPYNTGSAFGHFDDGIDHSQWLSLMRERLASLQKLLRPDGSIWISIDDNECHYLKVLMDEVFGRANFVTSIVWQSIYTVKNSARFFSGMHEYVLVYARDAQQWERNLLPRTAELDETYTNPDNDLRGPWTTNAIQARNYYSQGSYEIRSPSGKIFQPPAGTYWRVSQETFNQLNNDGRVWWGSDGGNVPRIKKFLAEAKQGVVPATLWLHDQVGQYAEAKQEVRALSHETDADVFSTPKPERLIQRILDLATKPGDLVLDSFAGSGTTGAVAHKMRRRWIMVELGEHCETHIVPRLRKVIDGEDQGGITEAVEWKGGGGFRHYHLAPSLLEKDAWGNWVISKEYDAAKVAQAVCKLMGFGYQPDDTRYWMQGRSSETDFIYVTTQSLTREQLASISEEVGDERTLLVCCKAFHADADAFHNLTVRKIPQAVLRKCEWGKDDYSLNVAKLPEPPREPDEHDYGAGPPKAGKKGGKAAPQDDLFNGEAGK